jgi:hypothetical protein
MLQLIVLAILFYIVQKLVHFVFGQNPKSPETKVRGQAQSKPLDLTQSEVEDVDFKEVPK